MFFKPFINSVVSLPCTTSLPYYQATPLPVYPHYYYPVLPHYQYTLTTNIPSLPVYPHYQYILTTSIPSLPVQYTLTTSIPSLPIYPHYFVTLLPVSYLPITSATSLYQYTLIYHCMLQCVCIRVACTYTNVLSKHIS